MSLTVEYVDIFYAGWAQSSLYRYFIREVSGISLLSRA